LLLRYTQQGIQKIKEAPARIDAAKKAFRAMGAEMKQYFSVMGQYDAVVIAEAPNDETVAKLALAVGSQGAIHTETLRGFTEDEFRKIIATLPWLVACEQIKKHRRVSLKEIFYQTGGNYEKELPESANMKPPKRGLNLFGGLLDIYNTDYAGNF